MYTKVEKVNEKKYVLKVVLDNKVETNLTMRVSRIWLGKSHDEIENKIKEFNGSLLGIFPNNRLKISIALFEFYEDAERYSDWVNSILLVKTLEGKI